MPISKIDSALTTAPCLLVELATGALIPCPLPADFPLRFSVALGNFDGVHAAHRQLIECALRRADDQTAQGVPTAAAAWCFAVPSGDFFTRDTPSHLTTMQEKLRLFAECGLRYAFVADFAAMRHFSTDTFTSRILRSECAVDAVACGFNYRYGANGAGTAQTLSADFGALCTVLPCRYLDGDNVHVISSSSIRTHLRQGDCETAARMLTRPYSLHGTVLHGKKLGRTLGFPTANLTFPEGKLIPRFGVYAAACEVNGVIYGGVCNIGLRPTVEDVKTVNCETHLLDFVGDIYGKEMSVHLIHFLREERRFSDVSKLRDTVLHDVANAADFLQSEAAAQWLDRIRVAPKFED